MGFEAYMPVDEFRDVAVGENLHQWLRYLDVGFYKNFKHSAGVADLADLTDKEAVLHFVSRGLKEGRAYSPYLLYFIDPEFYISRYPELALESPGDALRHWMYFGAFENKVPNPVTNMFLDSGVHLFQMGKVGSKSIESALKAAGYSGLLPHLHWSNEMVITYPGVFYSYQEIVEQRRDKKLIFISGVRDPLERVFSGMFQSANDPESSLTLKLLSDLSVASLEELRPKVSINLERVLNWFDHGYYVGLNVYDYPFDKEIGYSIIKRGNITVFLYRLEALDRCWEALSEVVGLSLRAEKCNVSSDKIDSYLLDVLKSREDVRNEFEVQIRTSNYFKKFL